MSALVATAEFPIPNDFMQPFGTLSGWVSDHRNARRVERDVAILMSQLEFISSMHINIGVHSATPGSEPEEQQASAVEDAMDVLHAMRTLHEALVSGFMIRRIRRDVDRFAPHLKSRLNRTIDAATEQLSELRAATAFLVGEDDDLQVGIELVPEVGEPLNPEDSHPSV